MVKYFKWVFCLVLVTMPSYVFSLTVEGDTVNSNETSNSFLRGDLILRTREGKVLTSVGSYQVSAGVKVDDRRPIGEWFSEPNKANVSLEFKDNRLVGVVIY